MLRQVVFKRGKGEGKRNRMMAKTKISRFLWLAMFTFVAIAAVPGIGNAVPVVYTWFGGTGAWENGANWDKGSVPGSGDQVNQVSGTCTISTAQACYVSLIGFGVAGLTTTLDIQAGGSLTQTQTEMIIGIAGGGPTAPGVVNVEGTATLASLRIGGEGTNNYGIMNINGGSTTVTAFGTYLGCRWDWPYLNTGIGIVNITNNGTFTINGQSAQGHRIEINTGSLINIEEGLLSVVGNNVSYLQGLINSGKIVSYGGRGVLTCYLSGGRTYVKTYNLCPDVNAGPSVERVWMSLPATIDLNGVVSDDGRPNPPGTVSALWTVNSAPAGATVLFNPSPGVLNPAVTFDTQGTYVLRLTANDSNLTAHDDIMITVYQEGYTGLVAHWGFDEESGSIAHDSVGEANGVLHGNPQWVPSGGKVGGCIDLDGFHDYIDCGTGAVWANLAYQISISAWIKPLPSFGYRPAIIAKGNNAWRLQWNKELNRIEFAGNNLSTNSVQTLSSYVDFNDEQWHQIFVTYDGVNIAFYVDGIQEVNSPSSGQINTNNWGVWIGSNAQAVQDGNDCYFAGLIDEVKVYEIGLPQEKVLEIYKAEGGSSSCAYYLEGDINHDCIVNLEDFARLAQRYMETNN